MKSWVRIVDRWFVASEFYGSTGLVSDEKKNILSSLQRAATRNCEAEFMQGPFPQALLSTDRKAQSVITMSHLESSLESSKLLQSPAEYRHWLLCYARRLADEGAELRAEDLCRELLGPLYRLSNSKTMTTSKWNPLILGFPKHELLREILPILGGNRCLQRISTEYSKSLKELAPENPMDQT
ncbi:hypothetical protein K493DRAFT_351041 [Basidiobolus meristosporus CBS 931.73]|uniref:Protein HIRA-like C-terminal domain-containing protein n=1 Tax=Basidiobolus meristosporus CBS 931.73 TaxID=1314790 RepID=A0A1Y1YDN5_9FUNG|nr:hypothetical protein K493DRAFT_351041 [Basidiobolus meristosporus CBS 931.73]|eukprot:ORX96151.1 hypothetical protein K493DRAFT_351041 [Basidiobolus meristosporus CBS 931.73]